MSAFIVLCLMAASVLGVFGLCAAVIWWAGRLPVGTAASAAAPRIGKSA